MLYPIAVAFLCALALLAIPVEIAFTIRRRERFHGSVSIGWLFGAVRARLPVRDSGAPADRGGEKKYSDSRDFGRRALALTRDAAFRRRLVRAAKDVLGAIKVSGLTLHARLGFADPADTGVLWGFVGPLAGLLAGMRSAAVRVEPEFIGETFKLDGSGTVRIIPLRLMFIVFALALSPATLRTVWLSR